MRHSVMSLIQISVTIQIIRLKNYVLNVFPLVVIGDLDIPSTWLQVDRHSFTKTLIVGGEREIKNVINVVVPIKIG